MNVLSLFDGMSCGQLALNKLGVQYDTYLASEVDKYAIQVTQANYPNTVQLGDVRRIIGKDLPSVDLLLGGSPCQGFSFAGKGLNFDDPRSSLFFEYVRLLKAIKPKWFLLENVVMKKEHEKVISEYLEIEPVMINSSLVSAQNRKRLYWSNLPITQPVDAQVTWGQIREHDVADNFYYSPRGLAWIKRHSARTGKQLRVWGDDEKCQMIEASHYKGYSAQRFFGIWDTYGLRYITPVECERAQTVPDNYTACVSNTQRYKMLGNGWTVNVIAHILQSLRDTIK